MKTTYFWPLIRFFASRWNTISHNSAKTPIISHYIDIFGFSAVKTERDTRLKRLSGYSNWEYLQSRSSIYIFTDSLFFLLCSFSSVSFCVHWAISQFFPRGSLTQMAGYNREFRSRLSFGQHESVGTSLTFRVSVYGWRNTVSILFRSDLKWIAIPYLFAYKPRP